MKISCFRPIVDAMQGYVPGEQPKVANLIKLNTNENPYPPSPRVREALVGAVYSNLRRYPDPTADALRDTIALLNGFKREEVLAVNGSDDALTLVFRAFTAPDKALVCLEPSYSLYPVLAQMQEAPVKRIQLDATRQFALPEDFIAQAQGANLAIITRPNAPTGNTFDLQKMAEFCAAFAGVVLFDEAYADFAPDNCMELAKRFDNVLVSRTMSKSYSLAGLRLGYLVGNKTLIAGLMKLKDSYNVDMLAQHLAQAALLDQEYLHTTRQQIFATRQRLTQELRKLGFEVVDSATNFVFAAPPDRNGRGWFEYLRENSVVGRYFPGEITGQYLRLTIGTDAEIDRVLQLTRNRYQKSC